MSPPVSASLPAALAPLRDARRWVVWRWTERTPGAKRDKVPFCPRDPRQNASTQNPKTWGTFAEAAGCPADGVGYVLRDDADHVFLDLDKCRDLATGELAPWAEALVEECDSYTEVTPSGRGVRIIGRNESLRTSIQRTVQMPDGGQVEIYHRCARYVTVSGQRLPSTPDALRPICDAALELLERAGVSKAGQPVAASSARGAMDADPTASADDVAEVLGVIPNNDASWDEWSHVGMATFRATGGSAAGFDAFRAWSARSPKHDDASCRERWEHWRRSPPVLLGYRSLRARADAAEAARFAGARAKGAEATAKKRDAARAMWTGCKPLAGTHAEAYITARVPGAAGLLGRIRPDALRFHPNLRHSDAGKGFPALAGAVTDGMGGEPFAVHWTYLDRVEAARAPVKSATALPGGPDGGGVWLTDPAARVVIGEGIETTLSGMAALGPEWGAVAALSAAGLEGLRLPPEVREVVVLVDVDAPNPKREGERPGGAAARAAAERWAAEDRTVRLAYPGARDGAVCDFNDLWQRSGRDAVLAAIESAAPFVSDAGRTLRDDIGKKVGEVVDKPPLPSNVRMPSIPVRDISEPPDRADEEAKMRRAAEDWARVAVRYHAWHGLNDRADEAATADLRQKRPDLVGAEQLPKDDPRRRERAEFMRKRRRHHTKTREAALRRAGWSKDAEAPCPVVLRATPGLGKTRAAIEALAGAITAAPVPVVVPWLVPSYALAGEAVKRFEAAGVPAVVLKGRDLETAAGEPLCQRAELADKVAKAGLPVRQTVCEKDGQPPCPCRHTCGYFRQWAEVPERGVVIATHNALANGRLPGASGKATLGPVVVDESPFAALEREAKEWPLSEVRAVADWLRDPPAGLEDEARSAAIAAAPVVDAVAGLLALPNCGGRGWRDVLGVDAAGVLAAASAIRGTMPSVTTSPRDEGSIQWAVRRAGEAAGRRRVADLLDVVAHDMEKQRPALQSVAARTRAAEDAKEAARVYRVLAATVRPDVPMLVLDGSADRHIYAAALGVAAFIEAKIEPALSVTHITQPSFSHRALGLPQGGEVNERNAVRWAEGQKRRDLALEAVRLAVRLHGRGKVFVAVPKALRMEWTGEKDPKGIEPWEAEGVLIGHFGSLRGQDAARDCDAVVVIGRPFPPRHAAEDMARRRFSGDALPLLGLIQEDPDASDDPDVKWCWDGLGRPGWHENFGEGRYPLRMRDGSELELATRCHIDPRVQACVRQVATDELEQAVHRIRPAQAAAGTMKAAYILSDTPHDLTVDRVVTLDSWRKWAEVCLAMQSGPLLLDRRTVAARAPVVFAGRDGGGVGESQQRREIDDLGQSIIADAECLRKSKGGQSSAIKNTSIWSMTAPPHVSGVRAKGEQLPRLALSREELAGNNGEISSIIGATIKARVCVMEVIDMRASEKRKSLFGELAEAQEYWRAANSDEARLAAFKRRDAAASAIMQTLTVEEVREVEARLPEQWSDAARDTSVQRLRSLLDQLDPFVGEDGELRNWLPDGRRLADLGSERKGVERLCDAFLKQPESLPVEFDERPYLRWLGWDWLRQLRAA